MTNHDTGRIWHCICSVGSTSDSPDTGPDPWCQEHGTEQLPDDLAALDAAETNPEIVAWFKRLFPNAQEHDIAEGDDE